MRNKADCDSTESAALPVEPTATRAYCWDSGDATTQQWLPQSVTTSGDADNDGKWGDDRVILAGWTHNDHKAGEPADDKGLARVAFIDANDPKNLRYRWVLLVAPLSGGKDFGAVRSHLGGMVWYQDKLIVTAKNGADHNNALFVFDMNRILQADVNSTEIGKVERRLVGTRLPVRDAGHRLVRPHRRSLFREQQQRGPLFRLDLPGPYVDTGQPGRERVVQLGWQ